MKTFARILALAVVSSAALTLLFRGAPLAQAPEAPKNLKVLPRTMTREQVVDVMRSISQALGVRCDQCHAQARNAAPGRPELDFASDEKPEKETARKMLRMVGSINEQIGQMGFKDTLEVRCVTCHHGVKRPETLAALLTRTVGEQGVDSALVRYRALRDRYYGTGAYDFSPHSLNEAAGTLAGVQKDYDAALRFLRLNLENAPQDAETYLTLGRVQLAKGDRDAAIVSLQKAVELDPEDRQAKAELERAKGAR